jgi:predicted transposase/invertase (TIGR01784 family)
MLQKGSIELAEKKGREEGRVEGRVEGKVEVARRLIAKGMTVEEAAEVAGVSVEVLRSGG